MTVKTILISQQRPLNMAPYDALVEKYGVNIDFRRFFMVEPLTSREFRTQRINFLDYTAVTFSSRHAIDAFFSLSEDLRIKIPETMKYFCTTSAVAMYLQKHIVYRKRKIFYGDGTPGSIIAQIGTKHAGEKFLITTSTDSSAKSLTSLFEAKGLDYSVAALIKSVPQDLKDLNLKDYDLVVFYNPNDVKSLQTNFPDFGQDSLLFISYGKSIVKAMQDAGLSIEVSAPSPQVPSAAKAIEVCLEKHKND